MSTRRPQRTMSMAHTGSSLDGLFEMLRDPVRRRILTALVQANPRNEDDAEFSPVDFATEDERRDAFLVSLQHTHLPKLADSRFIEWDQGTGTVTRGPRFDEMAALVELMMAHEDELPHDWP